MRAGTLSDARVLALLHRYFLSVHMPELVTKHLIEDPEELRLLEEYDRQCRERRDWAGLAGGEREVFLAPDGELLDVFLSLNVGSKDERQYTPQARRNPEVAVRRFFAGAERALRRSDDGVPEDFAALRDGTHEDVARFAAATAPDDSPPADGHQHVRVYVRNDLVMYTALVGASWFSLTPVEASALVPSDGGATTWPRASVLALARAAYPRGAGVLLELADHSIEGEITTTVLERDGRTARGRIAGRIAMTANDPAERGRRESYRPFRGLEVELFGEFAFDLEHERFTALRLASRSATLRCSRGKQDVIPAYEMAAELR